MPADFRVRFATAYDIEVQRWVDAAGRGEIDGPSAWDGYAAAAVCEAGIESLATGSPVDVEHWPTAGRSSDEEPLPVTPCSRKHREY